MRSIWRVVLGATITLLFFTKCFAQADPTNSISQLGITANLQTDGTAIITQDIFYTNPSDLNWVIYGDASSLTTIADDQTTPAESKSVGQTIQLTSSTVATHWELTYHASNVLIRHDNQDQFYLKLFENPNLQIFDINATFKLPGMVDANALSGNIYSIGGTEDPLTTKADSNTLLFTSPFASDKSLFTISASWPKGVIDYSWLANFKLSLLDLNLVPWLVFGLLLPITCLFILIDLVHKRRKNEVAITTINNKLPSDLSPILVGVLVNKKIKTNEIVAMLVDLCQRGYLIIVKKGGSFSLARRKTTDSNLQPWEQEILDQLFTSYGIEISNNNADPDQPLFSKKVILAFNNIYAIITSLNFFTENPHYTRVRYKLVGISVYLIGAAGLIWVTVLNSPNYLLIPFVAMLAIALLITKYSPQLVEYSSLGYQKRADWLAFANYMKQDKGFSWNAYQYHAFEKYLPYAIALGVTKEWARRFDESNLAIIKPDWFVSEGDVSVTELTNDIIDFTTAFAKNLAKLKGPLVS